MALRCAAAVRAVLRPQRCKSSEERLDIIEAIRQRDGARVNMLFRQRDGNEQIDLLRDIPHASDLMPAERGRRRCHAVPHRDRARSRSSS